MTLLRKKKGELYKFIQNKGRNFSWIKCQTLHHELEGKDSRVEFWNINNERRDKLEVHCGDEGPELWKKQWE